MSAILFENARIVDPSRGLDETGSLLIENSKIVAAGSEARNQGAPEGAEIVDLDGKAVMPGLVDSRVFIGEPGLNTAKQSLRQAGRLRQAASPPSS